MLGFKVTSEKSPFIIPVFCSEQVFSRASWITRCEPSETAPVAPEGSVSLWLVFWMWEVLDHAPSLGPSLCQPKVLCTWDTRSLGHVNCSLNARFWFCSALQAVSHLLPSSTLFSSHRSCE